MMSIRLSPTAYRTVCRTGILLVLAVETGGDPVVEGQDVPGEPPGRTE